ncbi:MAG: ribosome biogenesis GTPase YlqF [Clostridia bacterium]|nr:ribosome biogenesis GTPase YlqF [Clostridia bacterium]
MPSDRIQWFPGHMAKSRRMISENLKDVDLTIELLDARIPKSSENPEIARLVASKPKLTLLSKSSLADPAATEQWKKYFAAQGRECIFYDCRTGEGISAIAPAARRLCEDRLERYKEKGMEGRKLRAMIVGIPNVGKSSLINRLSSTNKAKVEDRPGVTLNKQWITTSLGIDLLDMPGILWPKFEDQRVGENLALTGAIRDEIMDVEMLACVLAGRLRERYPDLLIARYKLKPEDLEDTQDFELAERIGRKRGFLISGGEVNFLRTANMLLDEFRGGKLGRITIEVPDCEE